jgi:autotransporter-associated beta strand protein
MKKALLALAFVALLASQAPAANFWYDISATAGLGGSPAPGNWASGAGGAMWSSTAAGTDPSIRAWNTTGGGNAAIFAGTPANVPVTSGGVFVNAMTFEVDGYSVSPGAGASPAEINFVSSSANTVTVVNANDTATMNSPFQGATGYTKAGPGRLVLTNTSANNNITGTININNGILEVTAAGAIGGTSAGAGDVVINGGTLRNSDSAGTSHTFLTANRSIVIGANGGTIDAVTEPGTYTGTIGGTGVLTKTGAGEFRYQGAGTPNSTFSKLVVNEGLYRIGNAAGSSEVGFGAVPGSPTADAITLSNGGAIGASLSLTLDVNRGITLGAGGGGFNVSSGSIVVPSAITGAGNLLKNTTGTLTLTGNSDYSGNTLITAGTLVAGSANALGTTAGNTQVSGSSELQFNNTTVTTAEPISIAGAGVSGTTGAINATNSATTTLTGPVTLSAAATLTVSGTSTLTLSNAASITGVDQNLTLQGGGSSTGNGGTISGVIDLGAGSLTKAQGGTWRLNSPTGNVYSGGTIISSGVLEANNTSGSATGSGSVTVNGGTLGGTGAVAGPVTVAAGGSLAPGASIGSLNLGDDVNLLGTLSIEYDTNVTDIAVVVGDLTLGAASILEFVDISMPTAPLTGAVHVIATYGSLAGTFATVTDLPAGYTLNYAYNNGLSSNNIALVQQMVPEASAFLFGGLAIAAAGVGKIVARRRRRQANAAA